MKARILLIGFNILYYITLGALVAALIFPYTSFFYYKPFFIPFNQRLNHHDMVMVKGEVIRLYPQTFHKKVTYTSSDFNVAEVNNTGRVYAKNCGQAVIKVKMDKAVQKCRVKVIDLNYRSVTIKKGRTIKLKVLGASGFHWWKSSNKQIVSVTRFGKVKGVKEGTAYISVNIKGQQLKCKVKVK